MAAARPQVSVYNVEGASVAEVPLPAVLTAPIRPDVVNFVFTGLNKNHRQPYAVSEKAGHQTSAESWGTGRAVARIPRVGGGGTQRSGQGAFGNMCRSGRMFAPTKIWRRWHRKINITQKRYAVASALAASAVPALVMARGHRVDGVAEIPFVLDESFAKVDKTAQAVKVLGALGVGPELDKSKDSKKIRAGKGKMRNRRYVLRRGPLVIYSTGEEGVVKAVRNIVGVEAAHVDRLNLLQLAPGGHLGRFCIWTRGAFERLDAVFGTQTEKSQVKLDYVLPRAPMANADLARIINSEEVQSVVRPAVTETVRLPRKKNPLKNLAAMVRMNPYVLVHRRQELKRMAAAAGAKKGGKEKDEKKARKAAGRAFYEQASKEGDIKF
ncbi:hypothetical protein NSK_002531 [Nannochloropsis salina CCMP1776]|uniref:Large ribosomal subunit protein uL4 C-terminal domain-containing protein n=1 Tax=Nannochloropsis salina CCMP1776 TaxID=1027361 RepID=A0A4D9D8J9_9STRA|nr:hypothetical protein NSK_002531 [Nannochloropsis salina CCMP1776]|eukprot:TFJ86323.1 hypothetical protein NSK_002531 [Nannochloropsis salina CCMP1776]